LIESLRGESRPVFFSVSTIHNKPDIYKKQGSSHKNSMISSTNVTQVQVNEEKIIGYNIDRE
jgi:hypothetical protein